jgi:hypothetical protein
VITVQEISAGLYGAWRLAHGDKAGLAYFDASANGAKRSFYAALVALPIATVLLGLGLTHQDIDAPAARIVLVYLLAFALDWTAFPLAVLKLAPMMDCDDRILRYIPALNWARVLELVILLPAAAAGAAEMGGMGALFHLILMIVVLVYHWFVAKTALEVTGPQAAFLVGLNLVMGFIISLWALSVIR